MTSATDWRFAFTREGSNVPFATAGDCYSAAACPQVRKTGVRKERRVFTINEWSSEQMSLKIKKDLDNLLQFLL